MMSSHITSRACCVRIFSCISVAKCSMASGDIAERCGPRSTASQMSDFDQLRPVRVGHPNFAQSCRVSAAGWRRALPVGHMALRYGPRVRGSGVESCGTAPVCSVHWLCGIWFAFKHCFRRLFCFRIRFLSSPVTSIFVSSNVGGASPALCGVMLHSSLSNARSSHTLLSSVIRVRLVVFCILPCPPYINSVPVLKVSFGGGVSPCVSCPGACMRPRDGASLVPSVLMNLFAMSASSGPKFAASRFSPAVFTPLPPDVRLLSVP